MNIGERIIREIRYCACDCGGSKRVKINDAWKYFKGHNGKFNRGKVYKNRRILRETRTCLCGCIQNFECKINSNKKFVLGHNTRRNIPLEKRTCLCGCTEVFEVHPKSEKKYKNLSHWLHSINHSNIISYKMSGKESPIKGRSRGEVFSKKMSFVRLNSNKRFPSKETKAKQSLSKVNAIQNGTFNPHSNYTHGYFYSKKNNRNLYYMSSYELAAFQILESLVTVKSYKTQFIKIPYQYKDSLHNYIVDLFVEYIDGQKQLIEVKPKFKMCDLQNQNKLEVGKRFAEQNNMEFNVWTEDKIFGGTVNV